MRHLLLLLTLFAAWSLCGSETGSAQEAPVSKQAARRLQLIITDEHGRPVDDVQAADVELKEEGASVTVHSLKLIEKPVHYGLVIDVSGSLRSQFPMIHDAARRVISSNTWEDQGFILSFVDRVQIVQGSTSNKAALFAAIDQLMPERGQTALLDALYVGATELHKIRDPLRRRALVVITDGENRASKVTEKALFDLLRDTDFPLFIIGLPQELDRAGGFIRQSVLDRSLALMHKLTKETGGRLFLVKKDIEPRVTDEIAHDLRRQYVLKYRTTNVVAKPLVKVEIKVGEGKDKVKRKAIHRPSYTAQQLLNVDN